MKEEILLSILIPTIPERSVNFLNRIMNILNPQVENKPVELLVVSDNMKRTIGEKRNMMIDIAQGKYLSFIDDDDVVSENYVDLILDKIYNEPTDVIVFDATITFDGNNPKTVKYGIEYNYGNDDFTYFRKPNHLMVHKKSTIKERYQNIKFGEDDEWASRQAKHIKSQSRINENIYTYDYRTTTKKYQ